MLSVASVLDIRERRVGIDVTRAAAVAQLAAGADVNARGERRTTSLICAVAAGELEAVQILLDAKAKTSSRDAGGNMALSLARETGNEEMAGRIESAKGSLRRLFD
ncbi:MAG: ankyrin repeat protein [Myxococcota bacterium]|jgi:ankyrin repeat protein